MSTSDAVAREAAWLATTGDGLPGLLTAAGGPWDIIEAYWPRTPTTQQHAIYVLRTRIHDERVANVRRRPTYQFELRLVWPILTGTGAAQDEQAALDAAVDVLLQRIDGPPFDKTHGGRFLSVAENPRYVDVDFEDPARTVPAKTLSATVAYFADDFEVTD